MTEPGCVDHQKLTDKPTTIFQNIMRPLDPRKALRRLGIGIRAIVLWGLEYLGAGLLPVWLHSAFEITFGPSSEGTGIPPAEIAALSMVMTGLNVLTGLGGSLHSFGRPPTGLNRPLLFGNILLLCCCCAFYIGATLKVASFDTNHCWHGLWAAVLLSLPTSLLSWGPHPAGAVASVATPQRTAAPLPTPLTITGSAAASASPPSGQGIP